MNDDKLKVEGHSHLYKDKKTGVVVNRDKEGLERAKQMKLAKRKQKEEIESLKNEVSEIKNMLSTIINKLSDDNK